MSICDAGPRSLRALAVVFSATFLNGCGGDTTAPTTETCPSAGVAYCSAPAETVRQSAAAVADAQLRVLPALRNQAIAARMGEQLTAVSAALASGDVGVAKAAATTFWQLLVDARAQLTTYPGDAPDLMALELDFGPTAALLK